MIKKYSQFSLLPYNTFGIDVKTDTFIEYSAVNELKEILSEHNFPQQCFLHIGGGSNLLFVSDYKGTILHSRIDGIEIIDESEEWITLRVGAGVIWDDFVDYAVKNDWYGAENLSLIPGEVGASAVQNIGAYGTEIKDILEKVDTVEVASGKERIFTNEECQFSYRNSVFKNELKGQYIVTHVTYKLSKIPVYNLQYGNIQAELEKAKEQLSLSLVRKIIISIREAKLPDPKVEGNAGSFFMNPIIAADKFKSLKEQYPEIPCYEVDSAHTKIPAAWMIDRCGWKGKQLGNAGIHDKQALVIVNKGGATGQEIINLSDAVRASVKEKFDIDIHPEVIFISC